MKNQCDNIINFLSRNESPGAIRDASSKRSITAPTSEGFIAHESIRVEACRVIAVHGFVVVELTEGKHHSGTRGEKFAADDGGGSDSADGRGCAGET